MTTSTYHRPSSSLTLHHDTWSAAVNESEQVHLQLGGPGEMTVVFASATASTPSEVSWECLNCAVPTSGNVTGKAHAYSTLMYFTKYLTAPALGAPYATDAQIVALQNTSSWAFDPFYASEQGDSYSDSAKPQFGLGAYSNPQEVYTSPVLHTVRLQNLTGGTTYAYRVAGSERLFNFSMPVNGFNFSSPYPFVLALTADLGQTAASKANVLNLLQIATSEGPGRGVALLSGDLSYADGYGPRWDSYARMMEPLASAVPVMVTGGNHEFGDGEAWTAYNARYPMPSESSGSVSNLWWSRDIGPVHIIALCSYAATAAGSLQYEWLASDLAAVDRQSTPWLLVMMHAPWYNSNSGHIAEAELMRRDMEPLLFQYGVDVVLSGHVHAYERVAPVLNGCLNSCGPVYLNLGDGGNYEGTYIPWREPQPPWSEFRESSFGVGGLRILNESHAQYSWQRSSCEGSEDPTHINFNQSCESILWNQYGRPVDNSQFANVTSDVTWIVRPRPLPNPGLCPLPADLSPQTACSVVLLPLPPSPPEPPSPPPQPSPPQPPPSLPAQFGLGVVVGTAVAGTVCGGALVALALLIIIPWSRRKLPARPLIEPLNPLSSSTVTLVTGGNAEHTHAA
ncbi:purple acid phosphatase 22-like protein [Chrysochromulina tobinii]|uniref:Purple acid phosphatase n=1 Tax=Chrysochromulina tobinii TaxID=1460289 RepID=A0A0M0JRY9_9EUKA|nr:purple acid phosphatase 22-like protein [Chrysochromulina tobinii]|eukprot:KOO29270.1 purple acid phosphatase 22-like protein [Chrysochromulina sp. CCMP291]